MEKAQSSSQCSCSARPSGTTWVASSSCLVAHVGWAHVHRSAEESHAHAAPFGSTALSHAPLVAASSTHRSTTAQSSSAQTQVPLLPAVTSQEQRGCGEYRQSLRVAYRVQFHESFPAQLVDVAKTTAHIRAALSLQFSMLFMH